MLTRIIAILIVVVLHFTGGIATNICGVCDCDKIIQLINCDSKNIHGLHQLPTDSTPGYTAIDLDNNRLQMINTTFLLQFLPNLKLISVENNPQLCTIFNPANLTLLNYNTICPTPTSPFTTTPQKSSTSTSITTTSATSTTTCPQDPSSSLPEPVIINNSGFYTLISFLIFFIIFFVCIVARRLRKLCRGGRRVRVLRVPLNEFDLLPIPRAIPPLTGEDDDDDDDEVTIFTRFPHLPERMDSCVV